MGKDVSMYVSKIIQMLPKEDMEIKRLCKYLIQELSSAKTNNDYLIMSISPLHKVNKAKSDD